MLRKGTIIFTGHFEIGEKYSAEMKEMITFGKTIEGKPLILVGDIDITNKLVTYIRRGLNGLILLYRIRESNCSSECVLDQLPKTDEEIINRIDISIFDFMSEYVKERYSQLYKQIANHSFTKKDLDEILNNEIVPIIIKKRITEYGYDKENVIIMRCKYLRNIVKRRVSENKLKNWTHHSKFSKGDSGIYLEKEQIVSEIGNPLCRGIMFAFYEEIWNLGNLNLFHVVEKRHQRSIQKGIDLFLNNYKELIYLSSKEMNISIL